MLGFGADVPVFATLADALSGAPQTPEALLIGIAPQGGGLPPEWRDVLLAAIEAGLAIWSGLHTFLGDDPEISAAAAGAGVELRDLRRPPSGLPVASGLAAGSRAFRVLTVGTDCNVGKMTACLEIRRALEAKGIPADFAATGQTGILLEGRGIAVDAVVSDFVAGAAERLVLDAAPEADVLLIEGQGSLLHPGYSPVMLGLLHGALPQRLILCWMPARTHIYGGQHDWVAIPPLDHVVALYEEAMTWACPPEPCRVLGLAANTFGLPEDEARREVERAGEVTGLPSTDPIRFGAEALAEAIARAS